MNAKRTRGSTKAAEADERIGRIGKDTAAIVRAAAELLDEELAVGIVAAKQMQQRFRDERRIDPKDFQDALQKLRADAHGLVGVVESQIDELRSEAASESIKRLVGQSHELLDIVFELVNTATDVANQVAQSALAKPEKPAREQRK